MGRCTQAGRLAGLHSKPNTFHHKNFELVPFSICRFFSTNFYLTLARRCTTTGAHDFTPVPLQLMFINFFACKPHVFHDFLRCPAYAFLFAVIFLLLNILGYCIFIRTPNSRRAVKSFILIRKANSRDSVRIKPSIRIGSCFNRPSEPSFILLRTMSHVFDCFVYMNHCSVQ